MAGVQKRPASSDAMGEPERPSVFYWSQEHKLAFERLRFAATSRAPLTTFSGQIGTGRTSLLRELLKVQPSGFAVGNILLSMQATGDVFADVLAAFDAKRELPDDQDGKELALSNYLYSLHSERKIPTLIVDDADVLPTSYLLTLCSLSQTNAEQWPLLKIILVGRPGLTQLLTAESPDLAGPSIVLEGMREEDVAEYIQLRLSSTKGSEFHFTSEAIEEMCGQTRQLPGRINGIVDGCLQKAARQGIHEIDRSIVRLVAVSAVVRGPNNMMRARPPQTSRERPNASAESEAAGNACSAKVSKAEPHDGAKTPRVLEISRPVSRRQVRASLRFDRAVLGALTAVFLLGAAAIAHVSVPVTSFAEMRASIVDILSSARAGLAGVDSPDPDASDSLDSELIMAAQARIAGINEVLARTEPTAAGQFLAAIELAEIAADAAAVGYARAALSGHKRAAYYLGQIHETGEGVPVDLSLAKAWYKMAGPQIGGAVRRLADITAAQEDGSLSAPSQLFSKRLPGGSAELVWTSGQGHDPSFYRIELGAGAGETALSVQPITISAIRLTPPWDAVQWRVIAIDKSGQEAASPWLAIDPN